MKGTTSLFVIKVIMIIGMVPFVLSAVASVLLISTSQHHDGGGNALSIGLFVYFSYLFSLVTLFPSLVAMMIIKWRGHTKISLWMKILAGLAVIVISSFPIYSVLLSF
ncbi:hypothetical protein [Massilia sp. CCM 8734]|uniref:hypothetical protein n=1 Tax=Massilia sp. CCM 8734 TaxID=2609283 RepID=UPI00141E6027|nr:hypothetical protein [Massilia sp. CCM 8734]NHZ96103.1 hypothetical protein [Massilia sp. CCM 8734]